jgi:hypothetical protein
MRQNDLTDFEPSSRLRHDYILSVSLEELRTMFDAVCTGLKKKNGRAV